MQNEIRISKYILVILYYIIYNYADVIFKWRQNHKSVDLKNGPNGFPISEYPNKA